ncbi:MAG: rhodanese-like domain-containing protein [Thermomicrobiales bacterium]
MAKSMAQMIAEARARVEHLGPDQVAGEMAGGEVLLVDLREAGERAEHGMIPGAIHVPTGTLGSVADPSSPAHRPEFTTGRRIILHCASGVRSALAADAMAGLGFGNVAHLDGGIHAWETAGRPVEDAPSAPS